MQYYYIKDEENNNREDCIRMIDDSNKEWSVPNDPANRHWQEYQTWLALDPENNIPLEGE